MLIQAVFGIGVMVAVGVVSLNVYTARSPSIKALGAMPPLMLDVQRYVGAMNDCSPQMLLPEMLMYNGLMDQNYAAGLFDWVVEIPAQGPAVLVIRGEPSVLTAIAGAYAHERDDAQLKLRIPNATATNVPDLLISVTNEIGSFRVGCL
jgi:hypothetical protein